MHKLLTTLALAIWATSLSAAERLPQFKLEPDAVFITGLSSGGMMAVQYHAAFSSSVKGAAILAAGPYHCSGDNPNGKMKIERIMPCVFGYPDAAPSLAKLRENAAAGLIDPVQDMAKSRGYLYRGMDDPFVSASVFNALRDYYRALVPAGQLRLDDNRPLGHAFITDNPTDAACATGSAPFVFNCNFDQAGDILQWLTGVPLQPRADKASGKIITFDQREFSRTGAGNLSLAEQGYLYVPARMPPSSAIKSMVFPAPASTAGPTAIAC